MREEKRYPVFFMSQNITSSMVFSHTFVYFSMTFEGSQQVVNFVVAKGNSFRRSEKLGSCSLKGVRFHIEEPRWTCTNSRRDDDGDDALLHGKAVVKCRGV